MASEIHVAVVIRNLLESTADQNEEVINAIKASLYNLSKKYPNEILRTVCDYRTKNKLNSRQITYLLEIIAKIANEYIKMIDGDVVLSLIELSIDEMIKSNGVLHSDLEMRASDVLVALGNQHCIQVVEGIMLKITSGVIPHYMIIHTLGSLALANCYGTVPYVKSALTKMLPIMPMLKFDHHKQAFAYAVGNMSYSVTEYIANIQKAPDPTLNLETFSTEFTIAYDILAAGWLHTRELRVLESVLQALSTLILVLPTEKIVEQIPRIVPVLLSMYRKYGYMNNNTGVSINENHYGLLITKCLHSILSTTPPKNRSLIEMQLDDIVNQLVEQISPEEPDYIQFEQSKLLKKHSEILRCSDILFGYFPFRMIDHVTLQLKNNNEVIKLKAFVVISHMMNTQDETLKAQLKAFIPTLKQQLNESQLLKLKYTPIEIATNGVNGTWVELVNSTIGNRCKKVMLKIIVLITYHKFCDNEDLQLFLLYIIKLCCIQYPENNKALYDNGEYMERLEFQRVCNNSLYLLTTSANDLDSLLWTIFLQALTNMEYKVASCSIVRCLSHLANKFKETPELLTQNASINHKQIFVRCLALLALPLNNYQGTYVLNFLKNYASFIDNKCIALWEKRIVEINKYLEYTSENFDSNEWEYIILRFLNDTIIQINDEKWTCDFVDEFEKVMASFQQFSQEKGFILLCLANTITHLPITQNTFIESKVDSILCLLRSENEDEVKICAKMCMTCAQSHQKIILTKLNEISKNETNNKKSMKFFNFLSTTRGNENIDKIKLSLLTCYTEVALIDTQEMAIQLIELKVLPFAYDQLKTNSKIQIQIQSLKAIKNIVELFHQNQNIVNSKFFEDRDEMLFTILDLLYVSGNTGTQFTVNILETARTLVKLSPHLKASQKTKVFKIIFENLMPTKFDAGTTQLLLLLKEILVQQVTPTVLEEIFCLLQMWMIENESQQRLIAVKLLKDLFTCYLENIRFESTNNFELTGFIIGCIMPRCNDSIIEIRTEAVYCVNLVLNIATKYDGLSSSMTSMQDTDDLLNTEHLMEILLNIQSNDVNVVNEALAEYAKIISIKMPHYQLLNFAESLLNGLLDSEENSAIGVTIVLKTFLNVKGGEMFHYVEDVIVKILAVVEKINYVEVKMLALVSIAVLAQHHPKAVISSLLMQPLGYETSVPHCWKIMAEDSVLSTAAVLHFIRVISGSAVYDEQVSRDRMRIAMHQPLAAISAISDMFCWPVMEDLAQAQFSDLFCVLYISLASYIGVAAPIGVSPSKDTKDKYAGRNAYKLSPAKLALEAFKTFLTCANYEKISRNIVIDNNKMDCVDDNILGFVEMVPGLMLDICSMAPHVIPKLLTNLSNYRSSSYEPQRVAVYAFYCEYVHQRANIDVILLESTVSGLLEGQSDSCAAVRQLSLRGLGYLAYHNESLISRHSTAILNAFMNGLDEHKMCANTPTDAHTATNIPIESLKGLLNIVPTLDEEQFNTVHLNISMRIKPFFESEDPNLRSVAITLFGKLVAYSNKMALRQNALREQVNSNLICFLLHLSDPNKNVVKACNSALRNVVPILNAKKFNTFIQDHLIDEAKLNYTIFMPALIKIMAVEIPETFSYLLMSSLAYLKSKCAVIRANTAFVIGLLCHNLPENNTETTKSLETVAQRLIVLLKDNDANVRAKTAYALSNL